MNSRPDRLTVNIDNQVLEVDRGMTILQASAQHSIYIPSLCAHKELTPFGGCRMCIVEVEGMRGFPTACTTPVQDGMVIRTHTVQIHSIRSEIVQLILSEHPCSCLICDENDECQKYTSTIRKVGVTTGCRWCPNDGQCELHDVAEKLGIKEVDYPIYYRNLRVEKEDPFYDRDYNLCILCGRCVRMCQEIRTAGTLAFKQRGRQTVIGPAFGRSHFDAGCEFCGACVSVCPTGALSEKYRKWQGKPDRETSTTCSFCGVGCQVRLEIKGDEIIGSLPADDQLVNNGQLCVKGRFCIAELVNHHKRLKKPYAIHAGTRAELSWDDAIKLAAEKISSCSAAAFRMLVSPNLTNEDLYVAQKFVRTVLGSNRIDTTARVFYGSCFNEYLNLMQLSVPLSDLWKASTILCVGLDTRLARSVVGVELRRAAKRGAKIISVNPRQHNLTLVAEEWLQPKLGTEADLLESLVALTKKATPAATPKAAVADDIERVAVLLAGSSAPVILLGSDVLGYANSSRVLELIGQLASNIGAGVLPLPAQNNLLGSVLMGAYPELLPGGSCSFNEKRIDELARIWGVEPSRLKGQAFSGTAKPKVLYLLGELPRGDSPSADFMIYQNIFPPDDSFSADLVLPSAAFTEIDGTSINGEGRVQRVRKAVEPPGEARPDWQILCLIAQRIGAKGFDFASPTQIHSEISTLTGRFTDFENPDRHPAPLKHEGQLSASSLETQKVRKPDQAYPFLLSTTMIEHCYKGFPLSRWVDGLRKLYPTEILELNPGDAETAGICEGDAVVATGAHFEKTWQARLVDEQPAGALHVILPPGDGLGPNPHPVRIRKKDV